MYINLNKFSLVAFENIHIKCQKIYYLQDLFFYLHKVCYSVLKEIKYICICYFCYCAFELLFAVA